MEETVEIAASVLRSAAKELGKGIFATIKDQINYLFCFNSNIQSLRDEAQKLKDARDRLRMQVAEEENNARKIVPEVDTWLSNTSQILVEVRQIETDVPNVQNGYLTIIPRFSLSKRAKRTVETMMELQNSIIKFDLISLPPPPAASIPTPLGQTLGFESRKLIEEMIMESLRDKVGLIGICGMAGIGKTTLTRKVMNRVMEQRIFDETVLVSVSQQTDLFKIQRDIAELLGLKLEVESLQARANILRARLMGTKRVLVVLDDIWEKLRLENLGIPCEGCLKGCTTLLTCRNREMLNQMEAKVFALEILHEEEAWFLFRDKVGTCVDDPNLVSTAKEVARECKGLPVAIVTVAIALKDKQQPIWTDALHQLKTSNPRNMPQVLAEVYNPLYLSYKSLKDRHAKSLFLLCCLFPEDFSISLEHLTWYSMGLRLFEGVNNLKQARNRVFAVVELLKSRFLLLNNEHRHHVKMHDVIRDVAAFIASEKKLIDIHRELRGHSNRVCKWISVLSDSEFPDDLVGCNFPSLRFLVICGSMEIRDFSFLDGMKELNVLSFYEVSFKSLPETIQLLKNLRTLSLVKCSMETVSAVGELLNLEIFSCHSCHEIGELPVDTGRLKRLKSLDISGCKNLNRIMPGIISKLVKLEELKMLGSFKGWESAKVNEEERRNASIKELESLSKLRCLEIQIEDVNLVAEELCLSSKIVQYHIEVGELLHVRRVNRVLDKSMQLKLPTKINLGSWIHKLVRSTGELHLEGDGSKVLDLSQVQNRVGSLQIVDCGTVKKLMNTNLVDWRSGVFPLLEFLYLVHLPNLEEICEGPIPYGSNSFKNLETLRLERLPALKQLWKSPNQHVSLSNLRHVYIYGCGRLRNLFSLETAKDGFSHLESLRIIRCGMIEELLFDEKSEEDRKKSHITFPKLGRLELYSLPSLKNFCRGTESIEFPLLKKLWIDYCPELTAVVSPVERNQNWHNHNDDDQSLHTFCNQKVKFGGLKHLKITGYDDINNIWCQQISPYFFEKLEELEISYCANIRNLFLSSTARSFVNLKVLIIENCSKMEKVIGYKCEMMEETFLKEEKGKNKKRSCIAFPKLEELALGDMPSLTTFAEGIENIDFPVLNEIAIRNCSKFVNIVSSIGSHRNLRDGHCYASVHLFCFPKVKFGVLKKLEIQGCKNISNIWCQQIPVWFFRRLEELEICDCGSIRNLFLSSIIRTLVNLKNLRIKSCRRMKRVIANEMEDVMQDAEKVHEKSILFPSLKRFDLYCLPHLGIFCERRHAVELPSLSTIDICNCPRMEFLTLGSLYTPNLDRIWIDYKEYTKEELYGMEGLNGLIRQHMATRVESTSAEDEEERESTEAEDEEWKSTAAEDEGEWGINSS